MITIDIFLLNKVAKVGNDVQVSQRRSRGCFRLCVCILDDANHRIQKSDSIGNFRKEWGEEGL